MREIKGHHVLIVMVGAFAVIIGVNLTLAFFAVRTFPGLEVQNSYVASQSFDADRAAQEALGWTAEASYQPGMLTVEFSGAEGGVAAVATLEALVGRPTTTRDDFRPDFRQAGSTFTAPASLAPGNWNVRLRAQAADGTSFRQLLQLTVRSEG